MGMDENLILMVKTAVSQFTFELCIWALFFPFRRKWTFIEKNERIQVGLQSDNPTKGAKPKHELPIWQISNSKDQVRG